MLESGRRSTRRRDSYKPPEVPEPPEMALEGDEPPGPPAQSDLLEAGMPTGPASADVVSEAAPEQMVRDGLEQLAASWPWAKEMLTQFEQHMAEDEKKKAGEEEPIAPSAEPTGEDGEDRAAAAERRAESAKS